MKAIVMHQYGDAGVLKYEEVEKPVPGENEVLIQVKAAALNPIDSKIRNGFMKEVMPVSFPFIPGWEASGIVMETGKNVTNLKIGDEVFTRPSVKKAGSYAEYMTVDQNEATLKPQSLSFSDAAAMPLVASAAYILLFKTANIQAGQKVFILGAAGSVGLFAVQMAKSVGAYVIGTATGKDIQTVKSMGANEVIDYTTTDYANSLKDIDLAIDLVGGTAYDGLWKILKKGGTLLSTTMQPSPEKAKEYGVHASFVFTTPDKTVLEKISEMVNEGKLIPAVGITLPLSEVRAHQLMDSHAVSGKIILEMNR